MRNLERFKYALLKQALKLFPRRALFCPIPFKNIDVMPDGEARLCCYIYKSAGNVNQCDHLGEVYNSKTAQLIRASILDGTFRYCDLEHCPLFTNGDLPLQKDCAGTRYEEIIQKKLTVLDKIGVWLTMDARCNLRCITCRGEDFTFSAAQGKAAERVLDKVKADMANIRDLGFSGNGDPFASPLLRSFLCDFDAQAYPDTRITLLTNGNLIDSASWAAMSKAQAAVHSVQVSIDAATKSTYEKIRLGGDWDRLMNNLRFISGLHKDGRIEEFIISFVVNALNYMEMERFVEMGVELGCSQIYFSHIVDWGVLPPGQYKDLAIHQPKHPKYEELCHIVNGKIGSLPLVTLGNLSNLRIKDCLRDSMFS